MAVIVKKELLILVLIICSCVAKNNKDLMDTFGIKYNSIRKQFKIPLLDSSWKGSFREQYGDTVWISYSSLKNQKQSAIVKTIKIVKGELFFDQTVYESNKIFQTVDGTFHELVYINFTKQNNKDSFAWSAEYVSKQTT